MMISGEDVERICGIEAYATKAEGIGGVLKHKPEDFVVWEHLVNGLDAREEFEKPAPRPITSPYALYAARKKNLETLAAIKLLAEHLDVKISHIGACGIKDRRSISYMFLSAPTRKVVQSIDVCFGEKEFEVKLVRGVARPLSSRWLVANSFDIVISHTSMRDDALMEAFSRILSELGGAFPNFFGHQRFGITRPITHLVGKAILHGDYELAVRTLLFLSTRIEMGYNRERRVAAYQKWGRGEIAEFFKPNLRYEYIVARHLDLHGGDYLGALRRLPLRLKKLFIHAYASYIFNKALSRMLKEGVMLNEPEAGDIVGRLDRNGLLAGRVFQVHAGNLAACRRYASKGELGVFLPVVGYRTIIPRSGKGEIVREVLEEEGLELSLFACPSMPEARTPGEYRTPLTHFTGMEYQPTGYGVRVRFTLPRGSYATMLLREFMKPDSALAYSGRVKSKSIGV
ncbi:MAG: tRNA pseudouridine(13) synthase TruD [Aigarchaeota archaeon]|nr:tRNA pseudouridine(13) synthase TruD [Candidatus Pelearchaeum maunauluense]